MNLAVTEIKPFVPAADMEQSKAFYAALGFEIPWSSDDLAYLRYRGAAFLLQALDDRAFIDNYMMHLLVESADDWHAHVVASGVVERFGVRLTPPEDRPWAMRDFTLSDPAGVCWRIAENLPQRD